MTASKVAADEKCISDMLVRDRLSDTPWSTLVVLVMKKDVAPGFASITAV